jgi:hypothetical protein
MVFGGFSPRLISCGGGGDDGANSSSNYHSFEQLTQAEACIKLRQLRQEDYGDGLLFCEQPELEVQFESLAYEVG